jgi:5'-phosphate synthase pdxT subunit
MAKSVPGRDQPLLGAMDISVERNAYGRQIDSFEAEFSVKGISGEPLKALFIRAPKIVGATEKVEVLASYGNVPVLVRQGNILAASFHPELSDDLRIHSFFISTML